MERGQTEVGRIAVAFPLQLEKGSKVPRFEVGLSRSLPFRLGMSFLGCATPLWGFLGLFRRGDALWWVHSFFVMRGLLSFYLLGFWLGCFFLPSVGVLSDGDGTRSREGLLALYNFCEPGGPVIRDRSGSTTPVHLRIQGLNGIQRVAGGLRVVRDTRIVSMTAPKGMVQAVRSSGAFSVEAWIVPANDQQKGPARIVTLSRNGSERNFTLGQDGGKFDVRCRTNKSNKNGIPSLASQAKAVLPELTHVLYTRAKDGVFRLYLNGALNSEGRDEGSLRVWKDNVQFGLGNEVGGGRLWKGTYHLVALFDRALSSVEVMRHFNAGASAEDTPTQQMVQSSPQEKFFEQEVAPLIVEHCLECHDTHTAKGDLDLSWKGRALEGGKSGKAIVPGNLDESELWLSVFHDEMPDERELLSDDQKAVLKKWIEDGAVWSMDHIDPVLYQHANQSHANWVRRLTVSEYIRTVKTSVGVDISETAHKLLPKDLRADGFSNTAYNLNVDLKHVDAYAQLAGEIVRRMDVKAYANRFARNIKFTDKDMGALIESMGEWVLRGPINEHELFAYRGITTSVAAAGGSYEEAVSLVLEAMLQSPRFVYRVENHMGDGTVWPVEDHALATRISYLIWGSSPDKTLMDAAVRGDLYDDAKLGQQVDRMLNDERAVERSLEFASEWLNLNRLSNMAPNPEKFPDWNSQLAQDMKAETLAFFRELVWKDKRPLRELFNARFTYVTPELARHYGLPDRLIASGSKGLQRVQLPADSRRGGILTQGSVLTVGGDEASMVARGLFMLHEVLRGVVKDPPPCINVTPVATEAGLTQRGIAKQRIDNRLCGGCHEKFEPLAFGFEIFDGLGTFQKEDEHGNGLREDGRIRIPGQPGAREYQTSLELIDFLAANDRVQESITWKVAQFALGRPLTAEDASHVKSIHERSQDQGGTWQSLIKSIVLSDLVRTIKTEKPR